MSATYDTIVVGTGIGGLTAGLALQRQGHRVLLLEGAKQYGGMLNPFSRKGYHFDVGVHYLGKAGPGEVLRTDLDGLGLEDVRFREINPDCIDRYLFPGYEVRLVKGIDRWCDQLVADFPREEPAIRRFQRLMLLLDDALSPTGPSFTDLFRALPFTADLVRLLRAPFGALLKRYFEDPLLRAAFAGCGGDIGLPPGRVSALASLVVLNYYLGGAYYPIGGSGSIRDAYVRALGREGAELKRSQMVDRIERRPDGSFDVHTQRQECFHGRSVVSNVDIVHTLGLLRGCRASRRTRRKVPGLRPSLSCFSVFLATDLDIPACGISDANLWHYGSHDIDAIYERVASGTANEGEFFLITSPTLKDPDSGRSHPGEYTLEILSFAASDRYDAWCASPTMKRGEEYLEMKERIAARYILAAERYLPGLRDHLLHRESATPATVWSYVHSRASGIYGPEHSPDQFALRRFLPDVGIPGLYLAGASVLGCGISLCLKSGLMAAADTGKFLRKRRPASVAVTGSSLSAPAGGA